MKMRNFEKGCDEKGEKAMYYRICLFISLTVGVFLGGCGGGGGSEETPITGVLGPGDRQLPDGTYVDIWECRARKNGAAQVSMDSSRVDPFLWVFRKTDDGTFVEIDRDDDSGPGWNALVTFEVTRGRTYHIWANSFGEEAGSYTLIFSKELGDVTLRPNRGRSVVSEEYQHSTKPPKSQP
jgi:hypothetical protein